MTVNVSITCFACSHCSLLVDDDLTQELKLGIWESWIWKKNSSPPLNFALTQSKSILGHKRFIPMQVNLMAWNILRCQITFKIQTLVHVSKKFIVYENHVHQWWFCLVYFAWKVFLFQQLCWCCAPHVKRVIFLDQTLFYRLCVEGWLAFMYDGVEFFWMEFKSTYVGMQIALGLIT